MGPTRRHVLLAPLAGLMAQGAAARQGQRVAVIGAGMAGLAAARALTDAGADVTIYEARSRIGGRVWTSRLWPGLPVDMGASWIHGATGNPLTSLADQAGLSRVPTDYDSAAAFAPGGKEVSPDEPWTMVEAAQRRAQKADHDLSLKAAIEALPHWHKLAANERGNLRQAVHRTIEQEYAADWDQLSARHFDSDTSLSGPDLLFPQGMEALCHWAARGLRLQTGRHLRQLALTPRGVALGFEDGTAETADRVVLTVPLGVLRAGKIAFAPALSAERQAAIDRLGMGLMVKCWLHFEGPLPWGDVDWLEYVRPGADQAPPWAEWINGHPALGANVMLGFCAGRTAEEVERLPPDAAVASAMEVLRDMAGSRALPPLRGAQISRWGQDPASLGAYSYTATGATPQDRAALAGEEWEGRLIFAGEACSPRHPATVHGAWLSGLAAAQNILAQR